MTVEMEKKIQIREVSRRLKSQELGEELDVVGA